jgi:uncharacterized protein (DUF433 family)
MDTFGIHGIIIDPGIQGGQPVVESGIPVYLILDMLAQEFSREEMLQEYGISEEHIQIALRYAAVLLKRSGSSDAA